MSDTKNINENLIAIIGAGTMGSGIAQKYASSGFDVVLLDKDENGLSRAQITIQKMLAEGLSRGVFKEDEAKSIFARLRFSSDIKDCANARLIVEAIFEDFHAKRDLFQSLEDVVHRECILATNTSSFSVTELQTSLHYPERFLGLHYFYHPAKNRLVEVIPTNITSSETLSEAVLLQERIKKIIIRSADAPGFIVNRFFVPWLNEAVNILHQQLATIATIEHAAKEFFKIPFGPFELMNMTGIPITFHAANSLADQLGEFYAPCPLIGQQISFGNQWPLDGAIDDSKKTYVAQRLLGVVSAVCCRLAFEEEVASVSDVDLGARVGLLWPAGPFELFNNYSNMIDIEELASRHKSLYIPKVLEEHVQQKKSFPNAGTEIIFEDEIALIRFNRPDTMNALDTTLKNELSEAFTQLEEDPKVKGIIITGHARAFMAGADLGFFNQKIAQGRVSDIVQFASSAQELFLRIDKCAKPVVAAISGLALGGGLELALCCDKIIATIDAQLGFPETGIGIYPGLGGTQRTPLRVGPELARFLVLTGTLLSGSEAKVIGLIDECSNGQDLLDDAKIMIHNLLGNRQARDNVSTDAFKDLRTAFSAPFQASSRETLSERARKALERLSKKAPLAVHAADNLITQAHKTNLEQGLRLEIDGLEQIFHSEDARIGLQGALKKEPIKFSGR